jgi:hypothetical protein
MGRESDLGSMISRADSFEGNPSVSEGEILNAGRNETFGRGSRYCESLIRGREDKVRPRLRFGLEDKVRPRLRFGLLDWDRKRLSDSRVEYNPNILPNLGARRIFM